MNHRTIEIVPAPTIEHVIREKILPGMTPKGDTGIRRIEASIPGFMTKRKPHSRGTKPHKWRSRIKRKRNKV